MAAVVAGTGPAQAAPANGNTFTLDLACSGGNAYSVTLLETTPEQAAVHVVGTTSVLVPTAFAWRVVVTNAQGAVLSETTSPPVAAHGASAGGLDTVECTFTQFAHHDFPEIGPVTIATTGTVSGYLPR